jgi:hypothetical protein
MKNITLVTGLWDLGRDSLSEGWNRSYGHYLNKFQELLQIDNNLIIFGDSSLEEFVFKYRDKKNTQFIVRNLDWFKNNEYYHKIQNIRKDSNWYNQTGWLPESTQAKLEFYNPLVMSKIFLLHDAKILDSFGSDYMFWIDAGLTNTVHPGYFTHDKVIDKLSNYIDNFLFVCFPYEAQNEIHGFEINAMNKLTRAKTNKVARGGFFGGKKESITNVNNLYYNLLMSTLSEGLMGTEESLFTIMTYQYPELFKYAEIESNGLLSKFFEDLKNDNLETKSEKTEKIQSNIDLNKTALYVITFNSPNQFETLIKSMLEYDKDFLEKPKKFLLDNSTDLDTTPKYIELCEKYGFEHIKKDNIGITGGRVFVAEHFEETGLDIQIFFEDDMAFYTGNEISCRSGFQRYTRDLYEKSLEILKKESLDFLKLNFTEFYGSNDVQFSWYNVPSEFREKNWPEKPNLPVSGLDPDAPSTFFRKIKSHRGLPYAVGEVYLCNWPIILTKEGNRKCYLNTKFKYPHEQTLMSHVYQETVKGNIESGVLLLTPTEHNRFDFYDASLRKEC